MADTEFKGEAWFSKYHLYTFRCVMYSISFRFLKVYQGLPLHQNGPAVFYWHIAVILGPSFTGPFAAVLCWITSFSVQNLSLS